MRWRFINASADVHPLHLHGFYYRIAARGDESRDTLYWPAQQRMAVTELMLPQTTMDMAWYADRPGGWIFHLPSQFSCDPESFRAWRGDGTGQRSRQRGHLGHQRARLDGDAGNERTTSIWPPCGGLHAAHGYRTLCGMASVCRRSRASAHLYVRSDSVKCDTLRRFGYSLAGPGIIASGSSLRWPGPPIILHVGQPASVMVVNLTPEASQVHWHGLEPRRAFTTASPTSAATPPWSRR